MTPRHGVVMDFSNFIRHYGVDTISGIVGLPDNTIYQWVSRNRIPRDRWPELIKARRLRLTVDKLLAMEAASADSEAA